MPRRSPSLANATAKAIRNAKAAGKLTPDDEPLCNAAVKVAREIDAWDQIVAWALEDAAEAGDRRPKIPMHDNTQMAYFLRYMNELGLSPESRFKRGLAEQRVAPKSKVERQPVVDGKRGRLTAMRGGRA